MDPAIYSLSRHRKPAEVSVDHFTASYDYVAAADDLPGPANSAIDLDDASWDSELEVTETQFETSEAGEMSNDDEFDGVLAIRHGRSVAHRTQGCRRVSVRALSLRRAGFVPPPMSFEENMF